MKNWTVAVGKVGAEHIAYGFFATRKEARQHMVELRRGGIVGRVLQVTRASRFEQKGHDVIEPR